MWLDKIAFAQWLKLREKFDIKCLVETGAGDGIGARFYAYYFPKVFSCELDVEMMRGARRKVLGKKNIFLFHQSSPTFLGRFRRFYERGKMADTILFFLDAHWYKNWPVLDELQALQGFGNCVIIIHDFKIGGLGYVSYNGQDLDLDFVRRDLMAVNPNFRLYHNDRETACTYSKEEIAQVPGIVLDKETEWVLNYAWSSEAKKHRGMLYAIPGSLDSSFQLKEVIWT